MRALWKRTRWRWITSAWYAAQGEGSYRVALAGENVFLEKALSLREDIVLLRTTAQEAVEIENIDLYVFDGELPETLPQSGAVLAVNPKRRCARLPAARRGRPTAKCAYPRSARQAA